jgi:hypothetical protein
MAQHENANLKNPSKEWPAVSRQAEAIEEIDRLVKGDEPMGEKLKEVVEDHSDACDEIKEKFSSHKQLP